MYYVLKEAVQRMEEGWELLVNHSERHLFSNLPRAFRSAPNETGKQIFLDFWQWALTVESSKEEAEEFKEEAEEYPLDI